MEQNMGTMVIVLTCAAVLLMGAVRRKIEWLLNVVMRSVLGTIAIYFINSMLAQAGCALLWKMIREGRTFYRGLYLNLDTMRMTAVPV